MKTMKNYKILLFVIIASFIASCNDAIDIRQDGEQNDPDVVYTNLEDLERGLSGVYAVFPGEYEIEFTSIFTDEVGIGVANGGQGLISGEYGFALNPGTAAPRIMWQSYYSLINYANRILAASENIEYNTEDPTDVDTFNSIIGQLHAIRAYAHFKLLSYFSPDLTNDASPGVMLLDFVPSYDYDQHLPRLSTGEIFEFINEDLSIAEDNLPLNNISTSVGRDFVTALRARMAAFRENYPEARTYAELLTANYPLVQPDPYFAMWRDTDDSEVIFKLRRVLGNAQVAAAWYSVRVSRNGSPFYEVGRSLFNLLSPDDIRYHVIHLEGESQRSNNYQTTPNYRTDDVLLIGKYPGTPGNSSTLRQNDIKIFRSAEMYLIRAEAFADAGQLNGASNSVAASLRQIRNFRFGIAQPLPNYNNAQEAWADILKERRIEFAFEGHRYLDMKRLRAKAGGLAFERDPKDCVVNGQCTIPTEDRRYSFPIPTTELMANPNMTQNPEYQ